MEIFCAECGRFVGVIRDASIRKNTTYTCGDCNGSNPRKPCKRTPEGDEMLDKLKSMFGMR